MGAQSKLRALADDHRDGKCCCTWLDFIEVFDEYYAKHFGFKPAGAAVRAAHKDWLLGLTGWEAFQMQKQAARRVVLRADGGDVSPYPSRIIFDL